MSMVIPHQSPGVLSAVGNGSSCESEHLPPGVSYEEKLRELCCFGDAIKVREILRTQSVDVNSQNKVNGWTALHWASKRGYIQIVELLLHHGANPNILTSSNQLAVDLATDVNLFQLLSAHTHKQLAATSSSAAGGYSGSDDLSTSTTSSSNTPKRSIQSRVLPASNHLSYIGGGNSSQPSPPITQGTGSSNNSAVSVEDESIFWSRQSAAPPQSQLQLSGVTMKPPVIPLLNHQSSDGRTVVNNHHAPSPLVSSNESMFAAGNNAPTPPMTRHKEKILKVRVSDIADKDFVEIDLSPEKCTIQGLLEIACHELGLEYPVHIERIRKLPNTRLRRDVEVHRLTNYQELELVLSKQPPPATSRPPAPGGGGDRQETAAARRITTDLI